MKSTYKTTFFILLLLVLACALGVGRYVLIPRYYPQLLKKTAVATPIPSPASAAQDDTSFAQTPLQTSSVAAQLAVKLSPRQKVAQLLAVPSVITEKEAAPPIEKKATQTLGETPGSFVLFGKNISALQAEERIITLRRTPALPEITKTLPELSDSEKKLLQPLISVDHEGGAVQRLKGEGFTTIPSAADQCQMTADSLQPVIDRAAKELQASGIDVVFAPDLDIANKNPALRARICSGDRSKVQEFGERWVMALQKHNVIPVVKHYPGIGQTTVDLHQKAEVIEFNPIEHSVFIALLKKYPGIGVMTTHVSIKDGDSISKPCTISADCLDRLQVDRRTLRFTDAIEMAGVQGSVATQSAQNKLTMPEIALQAIMAGHSVVVLGQTASVDEADAVITRLADEYQRSPEFKVRVDDAVLMILSTKAAHWSVNE